MTGALHADVDEFRSCLPEIAGGTWLGTLGTRLALGQLMRTQPSTLRSLAYCAARVADNLLAFVVFDAMTRQRGSHSDNH